MYGIWDSRQKRFVFGIRETTAGRAERALFHKIGKQAYRWRYEVKRIPPHWRNPPNPNYRRRGGLTFDELDRILEKQRL